jgi:hypothetical protein
MRAACADDCRATVALEQFGRHFHIGGEIRYSLYFVLDCFPHATTVGD